MDEIHEWQHAQSIEILERAFKQLCAIAEKVDRRESLLYALKMLNRALDELEGW